MIDSSSSEFTDTQSGVVADRKQGGVTEPLSIAAACLEQSDDREPCYIAESSAEAQRCCLTLSGAFASTVGTQRIADHGMICRRLSLSPSPTRR